MTEEIANPNPHIFLLWARKWAFHPTVVLVARVSVAGLALGLGTAAAYVMSIDNKATAIEGKLNASVAAQTIKSIQIDSKIEAIDEQMDLSRSDRIEFQSDVRSSLDKLVDITSASQAIQAGQAEQINAIKERLTRIEQKL